MDLHTFWLPFSVLNKLGPGELSREALEQECREIEITGWDLGTTKFIGNLIQRTVAALAATLASTSAGRVA